MPSYRSEGVATLLSSVSHGGEHAGTVQMLRRERVVQPDGSVTEVPVISGNALRGILRDHSAGLLWRALGEPELPLPVFHVLWSGGALAKAGAGHVITSQQLAELRRLVPHVSLFGAAGGGRIIEGKLLVGKLTPVCAETAHIMPPGALAGGERSIWEMLQVEEFSRRDDAKRPALTAAIAGGGVLESGDGKPDGPAQQMRYGIETIAAGTRLHWWIGLRDVTGLEAETFRAALASWAADGAHLGGRSATGHGRLAISSDSWVSAAPALTAGSALPAGPEGHAAEHRDRILEALGWLG